MSVKAFLKTYGTVGVSVYGAVTAASVTSLYVTLRMGIADSLITTPLETILGEESDVVQKIKSQLGDAAAAQQGGDDKGINFAREGTYFGIAGIVDSLVLPLKLVICLPIAKQILKRRGR